MAFSLSNWFKGKPGSPDSENPGENPPANDSPHAAPADAPTPVAPQISSAVRKVVPNSVQPVSLRSTTSGMRPTPVPLPVSTPTSPAMTVPPGRVSPMIASSRNKISFGGAPAASPDAGTTSPGFASEPPPVAVPEVTVSLEVGDFIDRLPPGFVKPEATDRQRRVDFRASELYSDLTKGRASVPASVIYQKCPDLFSRPVTDEEDTEVPLPLQKLVEQMSQAFQTRPDQMAEENVGEIETPFLQVAMEDSARLPKAVGTTAGALRPVTPLPAAPVAASELPHRPHRTGQISTISVPKVVPEPAPMMSQAAPSASTVSPINAAKRPPSTVRASVAGGKIRLSGPSVPSRMAPAAVQPSTPFVPPVNVPGMPAEELPPSASQRILPPLQVPSGAAASPSHQVTKKTARIQIPPISLRGPGAPSRPAAPSAVPVQTSPVPVRPAPNAEPSAPPITFRSSPPPATAKPMPHSFAPPAPRPPVPPPAFPAAPSPVVPPVPVPVPAPAAAAPIQPRADERKISLSLSAILRGLPMSSLTVEPNSVPDDVRVKLPFALVERQLSQGRVVVSQGMFTAALPESHREVLASNSGLSEIPLPLQEVFQNLPPAALAIRQDQVVEEVGNAYPTPFSQKAEEDAHRFGATAAEPAPEATAAPAAPEPPPAPELSVDRPLPADPVAEEKTPEGAAISEEVPGNEFASLFVEEPAPPARDIPLDFDGDKSAAEDEPAAPAPVEAKAPSENEPAASPEKQAVPEPTPEARTEDKPAELSESRIEQAVEAKTDEQATEVPEPKPEARTEEKHEEVAEPKPADSTASKPEARTEEKPGESVKPSESVEPEPVVSAERKEEPKAAEPERTAPPVEPAVAASTNRLNGQASAPANARTSDTALQSLFMTEDDLDAKAIVRLVTALPGIEGCAVMFEDGLQLAGNFPAEGEVEGFSAMAPPFFKRTRNFAGEIYLGPLQAFTLYTESGLVSFFMHEHICLSVRHTGRGFLPGVREKLDTVTRELARMYATEGQTH